MGERTFNKHIYRVVFWNNSGEIKVTAPTTYEDAYKTAESYKGVIYKMFLKSCRPENKQKSN